MSKESTHSLMGQVVYAPGVLQAKEEWLVAALIAAHERIAELEERFNLHGHETVSRSGGFTSGTPKQVARRL